MPGGPCCSDCCNFLCVGWQTRRNHAYRILSRSHRGLRSYGGPKSGFSYSFLNGSYNSVTHYRGTLWLTSLMLTRTNYLRQVNEVNGGDNAFVRCVFVCWCVCVCLCVRSGRSWELNANSSKTVKATDFKFDSCSQGQSGHDPQKFSQKGVATVTWPPKFLGVKC